MKIAKLSSKLNSKERYLLGEILIDAIDSIDKTKLSDNAFEFCEVAKNGNDIKN